MVWSVRVSCGVYHAILVQLFIPLVVLGVTPHVLRVQRGQCVLLMCEIATPLSLPLQRPAPQGTQACLGAFKSDW